MDTHRIERLNAVSLGVDVARRAWLEKKDVINWDCCKTPCRCHSRETCPRPRSGSGNPGYQWNQWFLDSRLHGNDRKNHFATAPNCMSFDQLVKWLETED